MDERDHSKIREAYARFLLGREWDYFFTATFKKERSDAIRAHEHIWSSLHSAGAERCFIATESGRATGRIHCHGLITDRHVPYSTSGSREYFWLLKNVHGRSQVSAIRGKNDVAIYCAKYVMKGTQDYDFYGDWNFRFSQNGHLTKGV